MTNIKFGSCDSGMVWHMQLFNPTTGANIHIHVILLRGRGLRILKARD